MPDTDVNIRINETGAARAGATLDRMSGTLLKLSTGAAGLGQVVRLLGPEFDQLGQSVSNVAVSAAGLGQIGAIFGPIGAAVGTVTGLLGGLVLELTRTGDAAREAAEQARAGAAEVAGVTPGQTINRVSFNINITGRTEEQIRDEVDQRIARVMRQIGAGAPGSELRSEFTSFEERFLRTR